MKTHRVESCPACGATRMLRFELGGTAPLQRCAECETVSARTYADPSEIYRDGYLFGETEFGIDVRDPTFQEFLAKAASRRLNLIERACGVEHGRLLDVGCGTGEMLAVAQSRGWTVQGVEPEASAAEMARARGVAVTTAALVDSDLPDRGYDVVSAFHVLEHLPDSRSFLGLLSRYTRPGGYVAIEVPNFASVDRRRRRASWRHLRPLEHVVHFTPQTLARTLDGAGLEPVAVRSPSYVGPPQVLEQSLDDLARGDRLAAVLAPLAPRRRLNGYTVREPNRAGWALLRGIDAVYDRAGSGAVVLAVARAS